MNELSTLSSPVMTPLPDTLSARWESLRRNALQPDAWAGLAADYAARDLPLQAGHAARQAMLLAPALRPALDAQAIGDWHGEQPMLDTFGQAAGRQGAAFARRCHAAATACPGDWLSWLYLARLQEAGVDGGKDGAALPPPGHAQARAEALEPIAGETLHWLGRWRLVADDAAGAVAALGRLLDIRPVRFGSMLYLGEALLRVNNVAAAEKAFARASLSDNPAFLLHLASRSLSYNYWQEAIAVLHKALALQPDSVPHLLQLAEVHHHTYALAECRAVLGRIRELDPGNQEILPYEWNLPGRLGDARAHLASLRHAWAENGGRHTRLLSSISMTALYHDGLDAAEVFGLHREMCAPIDAGCVAETVFANPKTVDRTLRIGYVTGDLHSQHPVNLFLLPMLRRHDHRRCHIHVYHTGIVHDEYTRMAKECCDGWTEARTLDDRALQRAIIADGIDILIDLAGHTSTHRLGVFAMRAAPVQATFLGYPHSTGLAQMDWLIGDAVVSPAGHGHLYTEALAQLPASVFCWAPVDDYPLPPPRAATAGLGAPVVFGSFNNAVKITPKTIGMWAAILRAVPGSLLLLKSASLHNAEVTGRFARLFGEHGIGPERLLFRGPSGLHRMMQEYGDIDIALDTTPYNGGTTTLQALWMGVPVVALEGRNFVSRMGASFLRTLGRPEWVAHDEAGYVAAAVALASDVASLRNGRSALRAAMRPLCDIDSYTRHFEAALAGIWRSHCDGAGRRLLPAAEVVALATAPRGRQGNDFIAQAR